MKFYETHYEDYINSVEKFNLHPELGKIYNKFSNNIFELNNLLFYGPTGAGKYSQVLYLLKNYSPSKLKYDKKITAITDKQQYIYKISDIHYEVDMSLLGCNSKILWHEIFFQIVDIISVKQNKIGIILCKNFHFIHGELLEIFYSYMQQYNHSQSNIKIKFFILTEHVSFIPTTILNSCQMIRIDRPTKEKYSQLAFFSNFSLKTTDESSCSMNLEKINYVLNNIDMEGILNIKEVRSFSLLNKLEDIPKDIFNTICDNIILSIQQKNKLSFTEFRDTLYDILVYNLDVSECLWYILKYFIQNNSLKPKDISYILNKTYKFLKYYNNNYRPIYHLESIFFCIINKIHNYDELPNSV